MDATRFLKARQVHAPCGHGSAAADPPGGLSGHLQAVTGGCAPGSAWVPADSARAMFGGCACGRL